MSTKRILVSAGVCAATWALGYFGTKALAAGMSATSAYAVLVGWWLTAYTSASLTTPVLAIVPLFASYLVLFIVVALSGHSWFFRDVSSLSLVAVIGIGAAQAVVICTPLLFDGLVRRAILARHKKN
jgi:hypothetical protein